jgi:hypothetical protein
VNFGVGFFVSLYFGVYVTFNNPRILLKNIGINVEYESIYKTDECIFNL